MSVTAVIRWANAARNPMNAMDSLYRGIEQALEGLRFGHVQLVVHEGQVVRIERLEKIRVEPETEAQRHQPATPEVFPSHHSSR